MQTQTRQTFQYPSQVAHSSKEAKASDLASLLWRVIQRTSEAQSNQAQFLKDPMIKAANEIANDSTKLVQNISPLLLKFGRYRFSDFKAFAEKVIGEFRREIQYRGDRGKQFSLDILFQTIELISLNKSEMAAEGTINQLGVRDKASISDEDRRNVLLHFRAYIDLQKRIQGGAGVKAALERKEDIIIESARANPEITVSALDAMFRNFVAQFLLSMKFKCDTLIIEWMKEYGFGPDEMLKLANLVPFETHLTKFRTVYANGIQSLRLHQSADGESDLFLLRSLGNFYTSWTMKVAAMLPA